MSRRASGPPGFVRWLLWHLLPESEREFYLGDLEESGRRSWPGELVSVVALRLGHRPRRARTRRAGGMSFRAGEMRTDVRLGVRRLLRSPAATLTVLTALSLGIGMSALMFTLIDGALLPTLPFPAGERIVRVQRVEGARLSAEAFEYWVARQSSFEGLGAWVERMVNVTIEGEPESEGFGSLLARGATSQLGSRIVRTWLPEGLIIRLTMPLERLRA